MGILGRSHSPDRQRAGTTVIAGGTKLVGDLALSDNLHVDGELEGSVKSEAEVSIGEKGRVEGDISARRVLISGSFSGTIEAEKLEIVSTGLVTGTVRVDQLMIETGARFNGSSEVRTLEAPKQLGHDKREADSQKNNDKNRKDAKP
ncbi:MAG: bactofilin family protein [Wenzhouxiangella sp.]